MSDYFKNFPIITQPYVINGKTQNFQATDLMIRFAIKELLDSNSSVFYPYIWKDEDRPDTIAHHYYGDSSLFWVVYYSNNAFDFYLDFPKSYDDFQSYLLAKYNNGMTLTTPETIYAYIQSTVHHYETLPDGLIIDVATYNSLPPTARKAVSIYDWEDAQNESLRTVKLLSNTVVQDLLAQFKKAMKDASIDNET